jgi:hypothetical protein
LLFSPWGTRMPQRDHLVTKLPPTAEKRSPPDIAHGS